MSISTFFLSSSETRELHSDAKQRTHYYRNSFKECLKVIEKLAEDNRMDVRDVNDRHGEIYLLGNGFDAIITAIQLSPIETGIDIKINYFSFVGLGRPRKRIIEFYDYLDKNLKFKGISLHP
ncbi:MAG: hypothetical protein CVV56_04245 [Tenericutes bacterium HGW-Tenericutes-1]|jgi:hypothetical protein|nr:MAG: hypothetical protein CVV56_04245 [Tenericutes bacterium HGW-Tenericutes-1]